MSVLLHAGSPPVEEKLTLQLVQCIGGTPGAVALFGAPLFLLGTSDDRFDLPAKLRLVAQLAVSVGLLFFEISISHLDSLFVDPTILLVSFASVIFAVICSCGVLNAINMADYINGLLGSVSSISLLVMVWLALEANAVPEASLDLINIGLLLGYLMISLGGFGSCGRILFG